MTTALVQVNSIPALSVGPFVATRTGLIVQEEDVPFEVWEAYGMALEKVEGCIQWLRGDWLNFGEFSYGELYAQGIPEDWDKDGDTLIKYGWVARQIPLRRRRLKLSWAHHREVAPLEATDQDYFLDLAEREDWRRARLREEIRAWRRRHLIETIDDVPVSDRWNVWQANIETWEAPRSYDFIITDPPYPKEYLHLYETLARRASEWLKEGGLLVAMCGQSYIDEIYQMMNRYMEYYWTACYFTPGPAPHIWQRQVNTNWKPVLIYTLPGVSYEGKVFGDVWASEERDKAGHDWGQSVSGMGAIVSQLCLPGQYILDPFCGAGATGLAALANGCFFDGIDTDEDAIKMTKVRLNDQTET